MYQIENDVVFVALVPPLRTDVRGLVAAITRRRKMESRYIGEGEFQRFIVELRKQFGLN